MFYFASGPTADENWKRPISAYRPKFMINISYIEVVSFSDFIAIVPPDKHLSGGYGNKVWERLTLKWSVIYAHSLVPRHGRPNGTYTSNTREYSKYTLSPSLEARLGLGDFNTVNFQLLPCPFCIFESNRMWTFIKVTNYKLLTGYCLGNYRIQAQFDIQRRRAWSTWWK